MKTKDADFILATMRESIDQIEYLVSQLDKARNGGKIMPRYFTAEESIKQLNLAISAFLSNEE